MVMQFFTPWAVWIRPKICINKVCSRGCKNRKSHQKFKIMLESCQETSKLSVDSFMDPYDLIVPQELDFPKKIVEKLWNTCLTPPCLVKRVIFEMFQLQELLKNFWSIFSTKYVYSKCPLGSGLSNDNKYIALTCTRKKFASIIKKLHSEPPFEFQTQ